MMIIDQTLYMRTVLLIVVKANPTVQHIKHIFKLQIKPVNQI